MSDEFKTKEKQELALELFKAVDGNNGMLEQKLARFKECFKVVCELDNASLDGGTF